MAAQEVADASSVPEPRVFDILRDLEGPHRRRVRRHHRGYRGDPSRRDANRVRALATTAASPRPRARRRFRQR
ncbi:hypothetical protein [Halorussus pelagicus]|uniref:hypothetical protein n=1 Tax=Halorussus pelagicus TaxID=2505977 RepID=UPI0034A15AE6